MRSYESSSVAFPLRTIFFADSGRVNSSESVYVETFLLFARESLAKRSLHANHTTFATIDGRFT